MPSQKMKIGAVYFKIAVDATHQSGRSEAIFAAASFALASLVNRPKQVGPLPESRDILHPGLV